MEVVAEVAEALEAMAGLPAVAFSRLHVEQHLVTGVQVHVDAGGVAYQAAGQHLQLLVDEPRGLQGEGRQGGQAGPPAGRSLCHPHSTVLRDRLAAPPAPQTRLKVEKSW